MDDIKQAIQAVVEGNDLSIEDAEAAMGVIMDGEATPAQFGAFVTALRMKGETSAEIAGMAQGMRERSLHVEWDGDVVDTCGTGGTGSSEFNISTTAAFIVAGAGIPVAKHGNRSATSASGSADVLEALGVKIDLQPEGVERCLREVGVAFMFAQTFHPSMRHAGPLRPQLGIRTVFNILGPLTNPAGARKQVIGVGDPSLALKMAQALKLLGAEHVLLVHGGDGSDEISVSGNTEVWELKNGEITKGRARPADFGVPDGDPAHLKIDSPAHSAELVREVLAGEGGGHNAPPGVARSARTAALINAAAAIYVNDSASSYHEAAQIAAKSIDSGAAALKLDDLIRVSNESA
ncbi:MAG: anthranilate phosphoribosyltransferase [Chloroflexi bacterium]|nr:anthranilate phosphoribosyltransferase [Chloroflexota bacterium]